MNIGVREAAGLLRVSEKTVYRWIQAGTLPAYKMKDQYRFSRSELLMWVSSRRINIQPDTLPEQDPEPETRFSTALTAGGIHYRIHGADKSAVLLDAVAMLPLADGSDRQLLHNLIVGRESLGSTGLGQGVAVPHPRHPFEQIEQPLLSLCFLEQPVDFAAVDGVPVGALFVMVAPTLRSHLRLLAQTAFLLQQLDFRNAIAEQAHRNVILEIARALESRWFKEAAPSAE